MKIGKAIYTGSLILLSAFNAWSQATSASSISGLVTDQQQAAIPGAEVRVFDPSTSETLTAKTNDSGRYIFVNVKSGTYAVTVVKDGFSTFKVDALQVEIGTAATVNAVLQVGSTATTIEVTAASGAELVTSNASVGTSLSGDVLQALPNMGRDVSTLAVLQPGTTLGGFTAGAYNDQNTYQIDGGNATDDMAGNVTGYQTNFTGIGGTQTGGNPSATVPTPVESVEEFKVSTFNQTADFNNSIGGQIQIATKRGTNQFHGSAYGYYFATNLGAANTWANNHTPSGSLAYTPLPSNHRDRFGASLGGPMTPRILGGKTYFFFNYEGERFPNVGTYERLVPTDLMKLGVIQVANSAGTYVPYNLNPRAVTYNGVTYQPATCTGGNLCDPRGIGINPVVQKIWNTQMPGANDFSGAFGDTYNTAGYLSSVRAPLTSNAYVARVDHDFGDNWRLMSSYRYDRLINLTTNQVDIGGVFAGDKLGQPTAVAPRPQLPSYYVVGFSGSIRPNLISDFRLSYQREFWQWGSQAAPPQLPGLGGAVEIAAGTSATAESTNSLIPYNINTQSVRQRFWDAHDTFIREDLTLIKGQHLVQFGGSYQHNFDYHTRTDNGVGVNNQIVYQITPTNISFANSPYIPSTVPSSNQGVYSDLYSEVLGLVGQPQVAYTRSGNNLALQPVGTPAYDKSTIPSYNAYFSDTWKVKPNLTLTYSLGYALEMPPTEATGKQIALVDSAANPIGLQDFLAQRKTAALQGTPQNYTPSLGFALVGNVGKGLKYPYNPFYGEWSPRISAAWNPRFNDGILGKVIGNGVTVVRGGYSRIWGRLNGVNQVLTPLLGVGLIQAVVCQGASSSGQCLGANGVDPGNAFRIGTDGNTAPLPAASPTLAQPFFPGVNGNAAAGDTTVLDPSYKPQRTDNFTLSIQRQITQKTIIEVGYIGRIIKNETMETNIDAVPYMTTLGGQTFAQAYASVYSAIAAGTAPGAIAAQPFFENALGGAASASCKAYASCTAYVATTQTSLIKNTQVSDLWRALNTSASWALGRTMLSGNPTQAQSMEMVNSLGYGNYNAMYVTWRAHDFHHTTILSNFTYGKALGTATLAQYNSSYTQTDAFNIGANYGPNNFDYKFLYNLAMSYQTPWFKSQKGLLGKAAGGWTVAPLFFAQSGAPICVGWNEGSTASYQAYGESSSTSITSSAECAVSATPFTGGNSLHANVAGSSGTGTNNPTGLNMFSDPASVYNSFRRCVLGVDASCGGYGNLRGLPNWNLDASVNKDVSFWKEGVGATFSFTITNVLNHFQPSNPSSLSLTSQSTFGRITGQANTPRNMEFGLRIHF